jgi:hypothetical protein
LYSTTGVEAILHVLSLEKLPPEGELPLGDIGFRLPRHDRYNIHCKAFVATIC